MPKPDVRIVGDLMFGLLPLESKASKTFKLVNYGMQAVPFRVDCEKWVLCSYGIAFLVKVLYILHIYIYIHIGWCVHMALHSLFESIL